jgi:hypothetical protein
MDTARIGQDEVGPAHEIDEGHVIQRLGKSDIRMRTQMLEDRGLHVRIWADGINDMDLALRWSTNTTSES